MPTRMQEQCQQLGQHRRRVQQAYLAQIAGKNAALTREGTAAGWR